VHSGGRSQRRVMRQPDQGGFVSSLLGGMDKYHHAPENAIKWLLATIYMGLTVGVGVAAWLLWHFWGSHLGHAIERERYRVVTSARKCRSEWIANGCDNDRVAPKLQAFCDDMGDCMIEDPDAILFIKIAAAQIAEVVNEFVDKLSWKSTVFILSLLLSFGIVVLYLIKANITTKPDRTPASQPQHNNYPGPVEGGQNIVWVPLTPQVHRRRMNMMNEDTDTDASPPHMPTLLPPRTPSGRRSPSKTHRSQSPIKYSRTPSKGY
jgi:hypothetical protein